ncbi:uncharacterized protein LOC108468757 isoform X2 [Gossypium arboreum]|uniref:uncharacterized protein LOC108468757 isoform X2 n=1 Tax=Gossypium arboreum TaxID=29729 RepID=UPI0022F16418|nr:uncharacterized protein LOC108468757 isoform X2 [Gossypium arboreum]
MQSGRPQSVVSPIPQRIHSSQAADTRGKHRIQAELKRLEQEARFLEFQKLRLYAVLYVEYKGRTGADRKDGEGISCMQGHKWSYKSHVGSVV